MVPEERRCLSGPSMALMPEAGDCRQRRRDRPVPHGWPGPCPGTDRDRAGRPERDDPGHQRSTAASSAAWPTSLPTVLAQRKTLRGELEALLAAHPLAEILTSMPGVGPRTAIELLRTVGDGSAFPSAAHIASYAPP